MDSGEARKLQKLGRKSFGLFEGLFVTLPKTALLAIADDKIVGGFVYQLEQCGEKKIGYCSFLFTDPALQGQGIARRLCEEGVRRLWEEEGCDALVTFIRDDNVASWTTFVKNGFVLAGIPKMAALFGLPGMLKLFIKTTYITAVGHEFYIALQDKNTPLSLKKEGGGRQIAAYALINALLLIAVILRAVDMLFVIAALVVVFSGIIFAGYIGALFSKRKWRFRLVSGGAIIYLIINIGLGGLFPLIGGWYPERYENTPKFKRDMAINAIAVWVFLLALCVAGVITGDISRFLAYVSSVASHLLVLRCIPLAVFDSTGFGRVFKWNKIISILLTVVSLLVVFVL